MKGKQTKERIAIAAISLFNEFGVKNVRLQHLAERTGISVGNLAYHFADKKQILKYVEREISKEIAFLYSSNSKFVHFIDFDNHLSRFYHVLNKYSFYFLDILEIQRSYPDIHQSRKRKIQEMISHIHVWLAANVQREMIAETEKGEELGKLAEMIWFICAFWMTKSIILDQTEKQEREFKEAVWQQIRPFFTEHGKVEFEIMIKPGLLC